ncbi:glycoside hydrolase family 76 protein [Parathielavia hyrcaniae]|uniref:Glycoside hydrolase family 76 protein n=1 Tax=Parathielavia hyrcaniae TaxID=113614 RepID=A0AAN6QAJ3_9PEZI|nr:glycoside hydrolase family 76 protein [Parathielavia hyrcaniae]
MTRLGLFLFVLASHWVHLGLGYPSAPQHRDDGSSPDAAAHFNAPTAGQMAPHAGLLRPRQDFDAKEVSKAAIDAMNTKFYASSQAIWSPSDPWWLSGITLTNVIDYMLQTNSIDYLDQVKTIIETQRAAFNGDFRGESTDDTGWWALAMVRMYDLTGDSAYLDLARADEAYMYESWTASPCGGGIYVDIKAKTYKNAIANELFIKLAVSLYNRLGGAEPSYLDHALTAWSWFQGSGMINGSSNLINDGLASDSDGVCFNNKLPVWTYNQGVILGALAELYLATADTTHLASAHAIADAVLSPPATTTPQLASSDGILTEASCRPDESDGCDHDQQIFKGVFASNLAELARVTLLFISGSNDSDRGQAYRGFLGRNAQTAFAEARPGDGTHLYDVSWTGPFRNSTIGKQASAVGLLVAAIG